MGTRLIPGEVIERKIFMIRGHKVMLDKDLAILYGVSVKRLNEQARRNLKRFPDDFLFLLTKQEVMNLRSQFATSSWGGIGKHDENIQLIFETIHKLMAPPPVKPKPQIGFKPDPNWNKS